MNSIEKKINDKFWYEDPNMLLAFNRLTEFFPTPDMTVDEKLNSVTRLSLYVSMVMYAYTGNYLWLFVVIGALIITYLIFKNSDKMNKTIDLFKNMGDKKYPVNYVEPTKDNPFMNVLMTDYDDNVNREASIKRTTQYNPNLSKKIENKFSINLYKDLSDVYGKENSQRQFYTTPVTTIPNDQGKFAKWLYNTPKTCKEGNGAQCVANNYEPLYRYQNSGGSIAAPRGKGK